MHLVDRQRLPQRVGLEAAREPLGVVPGVLRRPDDGRVRRRHLGVEGDRVGLQPEPPFLRADLELVLRALQHARDEQLPDPGGAERAHRVQAAVPRVEVADDCDRARVRRPDRERGADDAVDVADVRAEPLVQPLVASLHREVQVELAERRQERVRVAERVRAPVRVRDLELVLERQARVREQRLPESGRVGQLRRDAGREDAHRARLRPPDPDDDPAVVVVRAEDTVGVGAELDHVTSSAPRAP